MAVISNNAIMMVNIFFRFCIKNGNELRISTNIRISWRIRPFVYSLHSQFVPQKMLESASFGLLPLDGFEQGFEITCAKTFRTHTLDDLEE